MSEIVLEQKSVAQAKPQMPPTLPLDPSPPAGRQVGSAIPVAPDCSMSIMSDGPVTQDGLDKLKSYIDLIKTSFPKASLVKPGDTGVHSARAVYAAARIGESETERI